MTWLNISGLSLLIISGIVLTFPLIKAKRTIREMVIVYPGHNPTFMNELLKDRKFGICGVILFICGNMLQLLSILLKFF